MQTVSSICFIIIRRKCVWPHWRPFSCGIIRTIALISQRKKFHWTNIEDANRCNESILKNIDRSSATPTLRIDGTVFAHSTILDSQWRKTICINTVPILPHRNGIVLQAYCPHRCDTHNKTKKLMEKVCFEIQIACYRNIKERIDIVIRTPMSGPNRFIRSVVILSLNKKNHGVPAIIITTCFQRFNK